MGWGGQGVAISSDIHLGGSLLTRSHIAGLALALAVPSAAVAAPGGTFTWIATGPGDQRDPAIDGRFVVYTDAGGTSRDVLAFDLLTGTTRAVAAGPGDADSPDVARSVVAYRVPAGVAVAYLATGALLRAGSEPGAAAPSVSTSVVAWEEGAPGERDIGFFAFGGGTAREGTLAAAGDQRQPAVSGTSVAFVDDASGGAVRLEDVARGESSVVCEGRATGVAIDGGPGALRIAVARATTGVDADVEVYDAGGALLAALRLPGEQRHPRLSGDWVALEDLSTGRSRVLLWNFRTAFLDVPRPSTAEQLLGDVSGDADAVRVTFAERSADGLDVGLYTLPLALAGGGGATIPRGARCDDPAAEVLAELALSRAPGARVEGELAFSDRAGADLPVLVCIDASRITAAWVALDGERLAGTADLLGDRAHLERRTVARGGDGLLSGGLSGSRGASLRVRVLADRTRDPNDGDAGPPEPPPPPAPAEPPVAGEPPPDSDPRPGPVETGTPGTDGGGAGPKAPPPGSGCASGGGTGGLALAGALALVRLRRRAARD